jgi:mycothiol synthase
MSLESRYRFRAPVAGDLEGVAAVLVAEQLTNGNEAVLDADFVERVWSRPGFDLAADAWVATDDAGAVVGYAQARLDEPGVVGSWGVVDPRHVGRGIGSALLDRIEARARGLLAGARSRRLRNSITAADGAAAAMLRARGFRPVRHYWHMRIDLDERVELGQPPDGIHIAPIDPVDDLKAVHGILVDAFAGDPGDHPGEFEPWVEEHVATPSFDPSLWLLAREGSVPVGVLIGTAGDDGGWVDWLAVLESHRGRGLGSALLRTAFAAFAERGIPRVTLNVDAENVTGATAVYERVGMRVANRWDLWERRGLPSP